MDESFLNSLIPTSLGVDDIKEVRNNPEKAEEVLYQRNDAIEKLRVWLKYINHLEAELKKAPSLTTQISVVVLNVFGTLLSSIGASDLKEPLHIAMLVIGVTMILLSSLLTVSSQVRDFVLHAIQHRQERQNSTPTK